MKNLIFPVGIEAGDAQHAFGVVVPDIPGCHSAGDTLEEAYANAKEAIAVVESVKAASDIYAPVKGTVVEVNKALEADPGLINREPYGQGWIFVLKIDNPDDLKQLKDAAAYGAVIGG